MRAARPSGNSTTAAAGDLILFPLEDGPATLGQFLEFLRFRVVDWLAALVGIDRFVQQVQERRRDSRHDVWLREGEAKGQADLVVGLRAAVPPLARTLFILRPSAIGHTFDRQHRRALSACSFKHYFAVPMV